MPERPLIPLVIVSGPTACGKTSLGIKIAKRFDGEVVSADSMQIYKGMNIASAQPTEEEKEGIPHHLMGFLDPGTPYSVYDFCSAAHEIIEDITFRNKLPILVGGTGLYINSLADDITLSPVGNTKLRNELLKVYHDFGIEPLYNELLEVDPDSAAKIDKNNVRRVIRAVEIYRTTGNTFSEYNALSKSKPSRYNTLWFNIEFSDRSILYDRINLRVDKMLADGLVKEAEDLRELCSADGAGQAIGHKELYPYLDSLCDLSAAADNLKAATRRYAKRQITWFKKRTDTVPLVADKEDIVNKAFDIIDKWSDQNGRKIEP